MLRAYDGLWTRGGAIELGIAAPLTLMMGADAPMRRHGADPAAPGGGLGRLVHDLDGLADGGYGELPGAAGRPGRARSGEAGGLLLGADAAAAVPSTGSAFFTVSL
ncbi:hypothetical protein EDD90_10188 [Streptomyces sp. Ag109_O5-1]|uniref:hypothetical protein n=1 Tax=Streptomyces sp. Ag109_O5-1 TaxID=1938851 RepID=UPI000FBF4A12|nr:hypothetical protein [Streptomyces sp. Ag109_O5-1]RPE46817.1 hypothetical protein EDD90_10188 [Streptomyces sp. Ag109_O5-1]